MPMKNPRTFAGITGEVVLDEKGDRHPNYWVWQANQDNVTHFDIWIEVKMARPAGQVRVFDSFAFVRLAIIVCDPLYPTVLTFSCGCGRHLGRCRVANGGDKANLCKQQNGFRFFNPESVLLPGGNKKA
jgi:hypothetical protein